MRDLGWIMQSNSPSGIVMREALKRSDFGTIDLLSCGSGHTVTEEEMRGYLADPPTWPVWEEDYSGQDWQRR